jgi:hypothetical protein
VAVDRVLSPPRNYLYGGGVCEIISIVRSRGSSLHRVKEQRTTVPTNRPLNSHRGLLVDPRVDHGLFADFGVDRCSTLRLVHGRRECHESAERLDGWYVRPLPTTFVPTTERHQTRQPSRPPGYPNVERRTRPDPRRHLRTRMCTSVVHREPPRCSPPSSCHQEVAEGLPRPGPPLGRRREVPERGSDAISSSCSFSSSPRARPYNPLSVPVPREPPVDAVRRSSSYSTTPYRPRPPPPRNPSTAHG